MIQHHAQSTAMQQLRFSPPSLSFKSVQALVYVSVQKGQHSMRKTDGQYDMTPTLSKVCAARWATQHHANMQLVVNNELKRADTSFSFCSSADWCPKIVRQ